MVTRSERAAWSSAATGSSGAGPGTGRCTTGHGWRPRPGRRRQEANGRGPTLRAVLRRYELEKAYLEYRRAHPGQPVHGPAAASGSSRSGTISVLGENPTARTKPLTTRPGSSRHRSSLTLGGHAREHRVERIYRSSADRPGAMNSAAFPQVTTWIHAGGQDVCRHRVSASLNGVSAGRTRGYGEAAGAARCTRPGAGGVTWVTGVNACGGTGRHLRGTGPRVA